MLLWSVIVPFAPGETTLLVGRVVDERGSPIPGATVRQLAHPSRFGARIGGEPEPTGLTATTGEDGRYALERAASYVLLEARAPGFAPIRSPDISGRGPEISMSDLMLRRSRPLIGLVLSAEGAPVPYARITVVPQGSVLASDGIRFSHQCPEPPERIADQRRRFDVPGLPFVPHVVWTSAPGCLATTATWNPGDPLLEVRLLRTDATLRGTAVDADGAP